RFSRDWSSDVCSSDLINSIHNEMTTKCLSHGRRPWQRRRLPRTVLIFIDNDHRRALERASACFDTYIEAMRGTAKFPPKEVLMRSEERRVGKSVELGG